MATGLELHPLDQGRLQSDIEVLEGVQETVECVKSRAVTEKGALLVHAHCQGTPCQQGEPLSKQPVPARAHRSKVKSGSTEGDIEKTEIHNDQYSVL